MRLWFRGLLICVVGLVMFLALVMFVLWLM